MRIGFDMLPVQALRDGLNGPGRYGRLLIEALLARADDHKYVLYVHDDLPLERIPGGARAERRVLRAGGSGPRNAFDAIARTNPDALDVLVLLDPFERSLQSMPPIGASRGLRLAAVVHGLERFLAQDAALRDPALLHDGLRLERLQRYDLLLADSAATRDDCLALLGLPTDRVGTLDAAADARLFSPAPDLSVSHEDRKTLEALGIRRPFVVLPGCSENLSAWAAVLNAWPLLPGSLRKSVQLVVVSSASLAVWERWHWMADLSPGAKALVDCRQPDAALLRLLYRRCAACVIPGPERSPGPLLEAMLCGAPVVVDVHSPMRALVGPAGIVAQVSDSLDLSLKLSELLENLGSARSLGQRAARHALQFDGRRAAESFLTALENTSAPSPRKRLRVDRRHRPRIALFAPLPPKKSGVANYTDEFIEYLTCKYEVDLFHESGYVPNRAFGPDGLRACDARFFPLYAAERKYRGIVYQMGNSPYHEFLYPALTHYPGIVTLHDLCLAGFHLNYGRTLGRGCEFAREELLRWYPQDADQIHEVVDRNQHDWVTIAKECAARGWFLNRRILESSQYVMVHSPWAWRTVRASAPELAHRVVLVTHGTNVQTRSESERAAIRRRFELPDSALIVASFGFLDPNKLHYETMIAFRALAREDPTALFLFVGEDSDGGHARREVVAAGLTEQVRFLGRQSWDDFIALMSVTDIAINLRRPPTNGESSGALMNLLSVGVATIVTDVGTFADFPDHVVRKVRWESEGTEGLTQALRELARDEHQRKTLGATAREYIHESHSWARVAQTYIDVIEHCAEREGEALDDRPLKEFGIKGTWPQGSAQLQFAFVSEHSGVAP